MQRSFSIPGFGGFSVGCKEVALDLSEGLLSTKVSYSWKNKELTGFVGVSGKALKDVASAEAGLYIVANGSGIKDVGIKAEAGALGAKVELDLSAAKGQLTSSIKVPLVDKPFETTTKIDSLRAD